MRIKRMQLVNTKRHLPQLQLVGARVLNNHIAPLVKRYLYALLVKNENADGTPRPGTPPQGAKHAKTIRRYAKLGWNTKHYLVATGKSTELKHQLTRGGTRLVIEPKGKKTLGYHIPESAHRGEIRWMELNESVQQEILETAQTELNRLFR